VTYEELQAENTRLRDEVDRLRSLLDDADQVTQDALGHQRAAFEGRLRKVELQEGDEVEYEGEKGKVSGVDFDFAGTQYVRVAWQEGSCLLACHRDAFWRAGDLTWLR
jgi:hypothetical protein